MISVAVLYPNQAGSKFDLDYYVHRHLPLVRDRLKPMGMRSLTYTVERAMDPAAPPQPYRLSAELRFDDMDSASRALQAGEQQGGKSPSQQSPGQQPPSEQSSGWESSSRTASVRSFPGKNSSADLVYGGAGLRHSAWNATHSLIVGTCRNLEARGGIDGVP